MPYGVSHSVNQSAVMTSRPKGLGMIRSCILIGSLGCLLLESGSGKGGGMKDSEPPDTVACAHACASATDLDIG